MIINGFACIVNIKKYFPTTKPCLQQNFKASAKLRRSPRLWQSGRSEWHGTVEPISVSPAEVAPASTEETSSLFQQAAECIANGDNARLESLLEQSSRLEEATDHQGRNLAHLVALEGSGNPEIASQSLLLLASALGGEYLTKKNKQTGVTPLHLAAWRLDVKAMRLIKELCSPDCFGVQDESKRTAAYYAAHNPNESIFEWMLDNLAPEIFTAGNLSGTNSLHVCAELHSVQLMQRAKDKLGKLDGFLQPGYLRRSGVLYAAKNRKHPEALEWFVSQLGSDCLKEQDEKKNTVLHLAAWFQVTDSLIQFIWKHLGANCFTWRDAKGRTAIHCAAANESTPPEDGNSAFLWLLSNDSAGLRMTLGAPDDEGRTCLHYCAANRSCGARYFRLAAEALGLASPSEAAQGSFDQQGRSPMFTACLLKNFEFLSADFIQPKIQARTDTSGNTLLHALFQQRQEFWSRDFELDLFFKEFERWQTDAQISITTENSAKHNCLMAAEISGPMLLGVLERLAQQPEKYRSLLTNSEGLHAIHVFATKYDLEKLRSDLLALGGLYNEQEFFSVRMPKGGPLKGATCLHLACEAGQEANIRYLTSIDLQLADETDAGCTCVDLAYNKGRLESLIRVVSKPDAAPDLADVLRLLDPPRRALRLPERDSALSLLASYSDDTAFSAVGAETEMDGQRYSAQTLLLARAFELNSSEMLRSLMVLGYMEGVQDDADFCHLMRARLLQSQKSSSLKDSFPDLQPEQLERPGVSIIDVAILTSRDGILNDLVMTTQFDLVPTCLRVLISIRPLTQRQHGKYEQMSRLTDRLTSTLVNVLEQLYLNADSNMKPLVFRYLTGGFVKYIGDEKCDEHQCGPRFPFDRSLTSGNKESKPEVEYLTILELIDLLDSEALFASECLSKLTKELWDRPEPFPWQQQETHFCGKEGRLGFSIKARFFLFIISYFVFLSYFAWFVCDFARTFANAGPDTVMWLFAAALTAHEIADFASSKQPVQIYFRQKIRLVPRYLMDFFNYCDLAALLFLWVGLALKARLLVTLSGETYGCQVTLATSFLLWGFRTLRLLAYQKSIGPKVSMLQCLLLEDLGPFLSILAVMIVSFGVFFLVLLYPALTVISGAPAAAIARPGWPTLREILTFPGFVAFTMYQKTDLTACSEENVAGGYTANLTCVHPDGREAFDGSMLFVFLLLVNIVMWNLLIALFSLSVARLASKTVVIWRKTSYDTLQQFRQVSFLPLPLSLLDNALLRPLAAAVQWCRDRNLRVHPSRGQSDSDSELPSQNQLQEWWRCTSSTKDYPEQYKSFLTYQALQLRLYRPTLQQGLEKHQSDYDGLRAHTENVLAESRRELLKDLTASFRRELHARPDGGERLTEIQEQLKKQRSAQKRLEKQMKEVLKALSEIQRKLPES